MTSPPERPDQRQAAISRAGSGPAPQTNVFPFIIIIGSRNQLLVYNPVAGAGHLFASVSGANGTDSFGNPVSAGFVAYAPGDASQYGGIGAGGQYFLGTLNPSSTILGPGGIVLHDSLVTSVAPSMVIESPVSNSTLPRSFSQVILFAQPEDKSRPAQVVISPTAATITTPSTTAALEVEGLISTSSGIELIVSGVAETVHQITGGFPAGWSGTISYWLTSDGVSARVNIDYHLTIANTTVVTNNEALGVSVASGYFYPTDNKFVFGQINGGGLAGNQFAPLRIDNAGGLHYSGPGFTASSSAFWYGGHTYAIAV